MPECGVLKDMPRAATAGYDSQRANTPPRCFEGTRTAILEKILRWANRPISDTSVESIYWLNGLAGIGKSTIARTVAEDAKRSELLGASFFFSHQEKELSDAMLFIPTIAYQLAQSYPEFSSAIVSVLQRDPDVVKKVPSTQIQDLILEPLRQITSRKPVLLVVDALDECDNSGNAAADLFRAVVDHCIKVPSLRLLVTSRPEKYITAILAEHQINGVVLHKDIEQSVVSDDIRKYLDAEMSRIPKRLHVELPSSWPTDTEVTKLVNKAGNLFIWAATAIRFMGDEDECNPASQLNILLGIDVDADASTRNPYEPLDNLYTAILLKAASKLRDGLLERMRIVMGTIVRLRSEMPLGALCRFLEKIPVRNTLDRIQSIIPVPADPLQLVQIYHPSFPDYITSRERCTNSQFHIDVATHERRLALRCLDTLNSQLSKEVESVLRPTEKISAVSKETVLGMVPLEVQYACRFWAVHVAFRPMDHDDEELVSKLEKFSSTMLLRWVIAMCILGSLSDAVAATRTMQKWIVSSTPIVFISVNDGFPG